MNNLTKRTLTGALFVIVLIGSIALSPFSFGVLFAIIVVLGLNEFYKLARTEQVLPLRYVGIVIGCVVFITNFLYAAGYVSAVIFVLYVPLIVAIPVAELYRKNDHPFIDISYTIFGVMYVAVPFSLCNYLVFSPLNKNVYNPVFLLGFFFLLWANDTGAYLIGSAIGKRRLFERISPKKSWEGTIGGGLSSLLIAWLLASVYGEMGLMHWLVVGLLVVIMGTFGDLTESLYKRSINIKDSGTILPGHGGILDRFDSVLLSAPFIFAYLQIITYFDI